MNTVKDMAKQIKTDLQAFSGDEYARTERLIRDTLFFITPQTVLKRYGTALEEVREWFVFGSFQSGNQQYQFDAAIFRAAVEQLWAQPTFAPDGSSADKLLNYLKKVMIGMLAERQQRKQAAGIHPTPNPLPKGEGEQLKPLPAGEGQGVGSKGGGSSWHDQTIAAMRQAQIDMTPVIAAIEETRPQIPDDLTPLDDLLMMHVQHAAPLVYQECLEAAENEFLGFRASWNQSTYLESVSASLHDRLRDALNIPIIL